MYHFPQEEAKKTQRKKGRPPTRKRTTTGELESILVSTFDGIFHYETRRDTKFIFMTFDRKCCMHVLLMYYGIFIPVMYLIGVHLCTFISHCTSFVLPGARSEVEEMSLYWQTAWAL